MLDHTVTHYFPWDDSDEARAYCGRRMTDADRHSPQPTCAACVAAMAAEDALEALIELPQVPLDADEAARELDPHLNAGADLFAYAVAVTRAYAARRIA